MLDIGPVLRKQVRTLSLGERMKCEICVSLLHEPSVLFLDEPTLGLDITMQARIRQFIANYNRQCGATICSPRTTWPTSPRSATDHCD